MTPYRSLTKQLVLATLFLTLATIDSAGAEEYPFPTKNKIVVPYWHPSFGYYRTCWEKWPLNTGMDCHCRPKGLQGPMVTPPFLEAPPADKEMPYANAGRRTGTVSPVGSPPLLQRVSHFLFGKRASRRVMVEPVHVEKAEVQLENAPPSTPRN